MHSKIAVNIADLCQTVPSIQTQGEWFEILTTVHWTKLLLLRCVLLAPLERRSEGDLKIRGRIETTVVNDRVSRGCRR